MKFFCKKTLHYLTILSLIFLWLFILPAYSANKEPVPLYRVTKYHIHTVKSGENLSKIAMSYYGEHEKVSFIAEYNNIKNINQLNIGQKIKIPIIELKQVEKVREFKEEDLAELEKSGTSPIKEIGLKEKEMNTKLDLAIFIFIIVCLLMLISLLLIRRFGMQNSHVMKDDDRENHFVIRS
ncbi:LysM peptidoglycan-binding domain-containing protein [Thermodesulfobacteriota bacterium]